MGPCAAANPIRVALPRNPKESQGKCSTVRHVTEVGIRALKQNASAVVARAAAGSV